MVLFNSSHYVAYIVFHFRIHELLMHWQDNYRMSWQTSWT